jgi:transcriptional regulator of arginine metabolism
MSTKGENMSKRERQKEILRIISSMDIETQHHLIEELEKVGVNATQATLSRDIKEMHLVKELSSNGVYRYVAGNKTGSQDHFVKLKTIFKESVTSLATASNIVVVKTLPGLAPAACSALDSMGIRNLIGTIAGDDTGFLAMSDIDAAKQFCKDIEKTLE